MRKILVVFGSIFAVPIVLGCAAFAYMQYSAWRLDDSSRRYVDESVPAIVGTWSKDELVRRGAPVLFRGTTDVRLTAVFQKMSKLGALISYGGAKGESNARMQLGIGTIPSERPATARYVAHSQFENGDAEITVDLIQNGNDWKITGFNVDAPILRQ